MPDNGLRMVMMGLFTVGGGIGMIITTIIAAVIVKGAIYTDIVFRAFAWTKFSYMALCSVWLTLASSPNTASGTTDYGFTNLKSETYNRRLMESAILLLVMALGTINDGTMESYLSSCQYNYDVYYKYFVDIEDGLYKAVANMQYVELAVGGFFTIGAFFLVTMTPKKK